MFSYKIFNEFAGYVRYYRNKWLGVCVSIHDLDPMRSYSYVTEKRVKAVGWNFGKGSEWYWEQLIAGTRLWSSLGSSGFCLFFCVASHEISIKVINHPLALFCMLARLRVSAKHTSAQIKWLSLYCRRVLIYYLMKLMLKFPLLVKWLSILIIQLTINRHWFKCQRGTEQDVFLFFPFFGHAYTVSHQVVPDNHLSKPHIDILKHQPNYTCWEW